MGKRDHAFNEPQSRHRVTQVQTSPNKTTKEATQMQVWGKGEQKGDVPQKGIRATGKKSPAAFVQFPPL